MQRIDTPTAVNGQFVNANPNIGRMATQLDESWFNSVQEELCNVVEGLGNELDKEKRNQIISALATRIFDYREVNAAEIPSITLSTLMKKTIIKMTGRTLTINGEFDLLVVVPGNVDVISQGSTVTIGSLSTVIRVDSGIVVWGDGRYSRFVTESSQGSVSIEPDSTVLSNDISNVPQSSVATFSVLGEGRKIVDVSASVLLRCEGSPGQVASGAAWICNASGVAEKKIPFKFLAFSAYSGYVPLTFRFVFDSLSYGTFSLRIACEENVEVRGGNLSFVKSYL